MITIYKRGRTWWVQWRAAGERHQISLRTRDRVVADAKRRELEFEVALRTLFDRAPSAVVET